MNLTKVFLIGLAIFAASCSSDDDAEPKIGKKKLSFLEADPITPPSSLMNSDNVHAQTAAGWISSANIMSAYAGFFETPAGATKSSTRITASNGRVNATGDFVTYIWNDTNSDQSIAYQITEESKKYVFEIFLKLDGGSDWVKYIDIEEQKDQSAGSMIVFDAIGFNDSPSTKLFEYSWTRNSNVLNLTMKIFGDENFTVDLVYNEKTQAGSVVYTISGNPLYEIEWDSNGEGTYILYDENGEISEEGEL